MFGLLVLAGTEELLHVYLVWFPCTCTCTCGHCTGQAQTQVLCAIVNVRSVITQMRAGLVRLSVPVRPFADAIAIVMLLLACAGRPRRFHIINNQYVFTRTQIHCNCDLWLHEAQRNGSVGPSIAEHKGCRV